jgi:hypothetical protein
LTGQTRRTLILYKKFIAQGELIDLKRRLIQEMENSIITTLSVHQKENLMQRLSIRFLFATLMSIMLVSLSSGVSMAQTPVPLPYASPYALLYDYYSAINRLDFVTAYNLRVKPRQTYDVFAAGFTGTSRVVPHFGAIEGVDPANNGSVRTVLMGYQTDGTVKSFVGCFTVTRASGDWRISTFRFDPLPTTQTLYQASIDALLNQPCGGTYRITGVVGDPEANAITTLRAYYDLLNQQNYGGAYAMWLSPLPGPKPNGAPATDYRTNYTTWVNGYATTEHIFVYPGAYLEMGASAGHSYLNGLLPVVLVSEHTDNTFEAYAGCYVMGFLPNGAMGIVNGRFTRFATTAPTSQEIEAHIPTDCVSLAIPN